MANEKNDNKSGEGTTSSELPTAPGTPETAAEAAPANKGAKAPIAATVANTEKLVEVVPIDDHKCTIAGKEIVLKKNVVAKLTQSEATILANAHVVIKK